MSLPLSNGYYQPGTQAEFADVLEVLTDLSEEIVSDIEILAKNPSDVLGGDSTTLQQEQTSNFISEHMMPMFAATKPQSPLDQPDVLMSKATDEEILNDLTAALSQIPQQQAIEDKNITANILFALNSPQRVTAEMNKNVSRQQPRRTNAEREDMQRLLAVEPRDSEGREAEISPMIEAIVNEFPQVSIALPGGIKLRIAVNRDGKTNVMYVTPEGTVKTLAKGKTLRLNRWVNGIAVRPDGSIALTP